jgi:peroxiredoxin
MVDYNYRNFRTTNYDYMAFPGPKAGDDMVDFSLTGLDGKEVKLSDYKGKWVVIETASLTCPMFVKNINPITALMPKYPNVEFLVVYVREAHPGSRVGPHETLVDKIALADRMKNEYGDVRNMLVDNLDGEMHKAYGSFPNMVYVVNPEGKVTYRCDWSYAHLIERALKERDKLHTVERKKIITAWPWVMIPVILKGGWDALFDQCKALPFIIWGHLKLDFFELFGKKKVKPASNAKDNAS